MKLAGLIKTLVESPDGKLPSKSPKIEKEVVKESPSPPVVVTKDVQATVVKRYASSDNDTGTIGVSSESSRITSEPRPLQSLKISTRTTSLASDMPFGRPSPGISRSPNPFQSHDFAYPQNSTSTQDYIIPTNPFYGASNSDDRIKNEYESDELRDQYNPFQPGPPYPVRPAYDRRQSQASSYYPNDPFMVLAPFDRPLIQGNTFYPPEAYAMNFDRRASQIPIGYQIDPSIYMGNYDRRQSYGNPYCHQEPSPYYSVGNPFATASNFMRTAMPFHYANVPVQNIQPMTFSAT